MANSVNELRVLMPSRSAGALNLVTPAACLSQLGLAVSSKLSHKHRHGSVSCPSHLTPCLHSFEANLSNSPSDKPVSSTQSLKIALFNSYARTVKEKIIISIHMVCCSNTFP